MAAYAALVSLSQTLNQILNHDRYSISLYEKEQIFSVKKCVILLQAFLEDFPNKAHNLEGRIRDEANKAEDTIENLLLVHIHSHWARMREVAKEARVRDVANEVEDTIENLLLVHIHSHLARIRDVGNEAEDTIENHMVQLIHPHRAPIIRDEPHKAKHPLMRNIIECICKHRAQLGYYIHELKIFRGIIKSMTKEAMKTKNTILYFQQLHLPPAAAAAAASSKLAVTHKDVLIDKDDMIGFDNELIEMQSRLCGESSQLQVIPVFGIGGIGKTTLARIAYDDPLITEYFYIRAWVTISQNYSAQEISSSLLASMEGFNAEISGQSNEEKLCKSLKGRRYLIVMDDMWSTKAWDEVRNIFPNDRNGSRIMLTTRLFNVAVYPDLCNSVYKMPFMDENLSWNLLRRKVFAHQVCPPELEDAGKEIARSCRGLPLAIVVTAGLLSTISKSPASWGAISEYVNSVFAAKKGQSEEILSLSYADLYYHFRLCFLYMGGGFLEDHEVRVSKVIKLWITTIKNLMSLRIYPRRAQLGYHTHDLKKVTPKIESISQQLKEVMNTNDSFKIKDEQQLCDFSAATSSSELAPTHNDVMIGFDDNLMAMKRKLCGKPSQLQVITIFGMGGIGKTTLARNVYDDTLIMERFHIRAWVKISQNYSVQDIFSSLLVSMEGFNAETSGQSDDEKVYKSLKGRRYLIVMDDMWSTKAWDEVRNIFPNDSNGNRIMLTTRLSDVAAYPDFRSSIHEMCFMDEDQSWNLLRQKVFAHQDCPLELENTGKKIARSCRGLPLAIVVIAGLLSTVNKNPASWGEIAENVNSVVASKHGQFGEMLSLSYTHLPPHLRPCFLYLGGFPEDHEVCVSKLIKLWVAEGFLKCPNGSKSFEEVAEECLESLVKRSLVLVTKRKSTGRIKSCSLHDLMRDLCIRKAREEKFLLNIRDGYFQEELSNSCRMSIAFPGPVPYISKTYGSTIHTIMWFLRTSLPSLKSFRLLRVLDAGDANIKSLPPELFRLFHLRYLAINYPRRIPAAISNLQNLQTLIIRSTSQWKLDAKHMDCLPQEIWWMPQLRHLLFYGALPDPEGKTSTLKNLQTLHFSLSFYMYIEAILKMIPNLKKLEINCCNSQGSTYLNNLVYLHQLENLKLRSYSIYAVWQKDFAFPRMLKKLTLCGLRLSWDEMTSVCSLPNLQVLKLKDYACRDNRWEITEGKFPKLEILLIGKSNLEHWITESSHFPRLKFLLIHDSCRLSEIPDGIGEIQTLELIEVRGRVKKTLVESAKRIQEEQRNWGNDAFKLVAQNINML